MSFSISCIYVRVFQGSFFPPWNVLWPIHGSHTQINRLQPALKKMKYDVLENIRICGPWQEEVNVTLNLFQWEGDTAYSDIQWPCNWNKFNEIKLAAWIMDLLGLQLCVSFALRELAKFLFQMYQFTLQFLSRKTQENMDSKDRWMLENE